ncbi:MAG: hypothetical protein KGY69_19335, partial [Bacteroidales bacterium]|nr:hypothetical protein [Bacteroidales bacterium]
AKQQLQATPLEYPTPSDSTPIKQKKVSRGKQGKHETPTPTGSPQNNLYLKTFNLAGPQP